MLALLPPDINVSEVRWTGQDKTLRAGLLAGKVEEDWGAITLTVDQAERL